MHVLDWYRLAIGMAFLLLASYTDIRTRRAPNYIWAMVMGAAVVILASELIIDGHIIELLLLPMIAILLMPPFFESGPRTDLSENIVANWIWYLLAGISVLSLISFIMMNGDASYLAIPALIIMVYGMYMFGLLAGGGDAKGMISIVLLTPFAPQDWSPLWKTTVAFPFPVMVLTNALLLSLTIPLALFIVNIFRRDLGFPEMFLGYRMDLDKARESYVWPMYKVVDGALVMILMPRKRFDDSDFDLLAEAGEKKIWVTPKTPFMIPITMGFFSAFFLGDLMNVVVGLLVP